MDDLILNGKGDTPYLYLALKDYRDRTGDTRGIEDLPLEVLSQLLRDAHRLITFERNLAAPKEAK